MDRGIEKQVSSATLGALALFALSSALAAPPQGRLSQPRPQSQIQTLGQHLALGGQHPALGGQHPVLGPRLDLRAPSATLDAGQKPASFPSMSHHGGDASPDQPAWPGLGANAMHARPGVQEFVQRVRHEGLPVARLFESKSALVHLGLSPKGKPGLWLVQKIH